MTDQWLIIPIETKIRELYGKSLLAACAVDAGMQVILGDQRVISQSLHNLPRGIYIDKSISRTKLAHFKRLRQMGFAIAAWCEEGLAYRDKSAYQFERISSDSVDQVAAFFAWGDAQNNDVLEAAQRAVGKTHITGNPRFDLLQPALRRVFDDEVREIQSRHGRYILINTNFSRYNRFRGREDVVDVLRARGLLSRNDQADYYRRSVEHLGDVFQAFAAAIPQLANAFPDLTIIVRPHPSENHERWREELAGIRNVRVIADGNAIPWMMGAETVIHNACTTGVEAFLLDRPTIAYVPVEHEIFNRLTYFPNAISKVAVNLNELLRTVGQALSQERPFDVDMPEKRRCAAQHVANVSGELAGEKIVRILTAMKDSELQNPNLLRQAGARMISFARSKAARAKRLLRPNKALHAYMDQKFPDLTLGELQDVLHKISRARGQTFALNVTAHPRLKSCFVIQRRTSQKVATQAPSSA
jgi:surface carbohydrate biosynthesis protein